MSTFEPLATALESWFDHPLNELPDNLRQRVETCFVFMRPESNSASPIDGPGGGYGGISRMVIPPWDDLAANQRCAAAMQWDFANDPALEGLRQELWDGEIEIDELKADIEKIESMSPSTLGEVQIRDTKLTELRTRLAAAEARISAATGSIHPAEHGVGLPARKAVTRAALDALYQARQEEWKSSHGHLPTSDEDEIWRKAEKISRGRLRELRRQHRPQEAKTGGNPHKSNANG